MKFLMFLMGACAGCAGTYILLKKKYDNDMTEELVKIKRHYEGGNEPTKAKEPPKKTEDIHPEFETGEVSPPPTKPDLKDYAHMIVEKEKPAPIRSKEEVSTDLRILSSKEEFEDLSDDYRVEDLIIYSDGVVTDIRDNIVFDKFQDVIGAIQGEDFDDDGYLYVADDLRNRLYEISKDERSYKSVFEEV